MFLSTICMRNPAFCAGFAKTSIYPTALLFRLMLEVLSATAIADYLQVDFALIYKERVKANVVGRMVLVGNV